jgi:hypothetical protein
MKHPLNGAPFTYQGGITMKTIEGLKDSKELLYNYTIVRYAGQFPADSNRGGKEGDSANSFSSCC